MKIIGEIQTPVDNSISPEELHQFYLYGKDLLSRGSSSDELYSKLAQAIQDYERKHNIK
jgi:hypothetical protein